MHIQEHSQFPPYLDGHNYGHSAIGIGYRSDDVALAMGIINSNGDIYGYLIYVSGSYGYPHLANGWLLDSTKCMIVF